MQSHTLLKRLMTSIQNTSPAVYQVKCRSGIFLENSDFHSIILWGGIMPSKLKMVALHSSKTGNNLAIPVKYFDFIHWLRINHFDVFRITQLWIMISKAKFLTQSFWLKNLKRRCWNLIIYCKSFFYSSYAEPSLIRNVAN